MAIVVAVVAGAATYTVKATTESEQALDPMPALLAEVHALRMAMEQSASLTPRVQLTLARLNIEEQRITQLSGEFERVRRELTAASVESGKLSDRLAEIEKGLQTASDEKTRRMFDVALIEVKRQEGSQRRLEQQLHTRENETAQALSTEQGRWIDLNARLDDLERLLAPIPR
jgi:chromosome segregation ATPase